jgi:CheY-like chemotaxis protein
MSFTEKIDVLELLINLLKEHDKKLDDLIGNMEVIEKTIKQNPILAKPIIEYDGTILEKSYQKILVVDDDINLANSFKLILENVGFHVDTAPSGISAINKMGEKDYDLVLLDLNLPDILGYEVADEIDQDTEFIYITGDCDLIDEEDLLYDKELLLKPIDPDMLIEVTSSVLKENSSKINRKPTEDLKIDGIVHSHLF